MPAELSWSQPVSEGAGSRRRVWKILIQCVEPRDKSGRKGRGGEGEKEKHSPEDVSSSFYTTLQTAQDFSAFTTECSGKKERKSTVSHQRAGK